MALDKFLELADRLQETSFMRNPYSCLIPVAGMVPFFVQEAKKLLEAKDLAAQNGTDPVGYFPLSTHVKLAALTIYNTNIIFSAMYIALEGFPKL